MVFEYNTIQYKLAQIRKDVYYLKFHAIHELANPDLFGLTRGEIE